MVSMCCNTVSRLFIDQLFRCGDLSESVSSCSVCSLDLHVIFGLIVKKSLKCRYGFCLFFVSQCSLNIQPENFPNIQSYSGNDMKGAHSALLVKFSIQKVCIMPVSHFICI